MELIKILYLVQICVLAAAEEGQFDLEQFFETLGVYDFASRHHVSKPRHQPFAISGEILALDESICHENPACAQVYSQRYVSMDGTCNNRVELNRGRAHRTLKRILPPAYADKKGEPRTGSFFRPLPSAREISTKMSAVASEQSRIFSHLVPFWGQFIIHDISLTPLFESDIGGDEEECTCDDPEKECINIPIPKNDIQYDEEEKTCFSVKRSLPVAKGGELGCDTSVRQQMNRLTAFIDLGTIYGNDQYYLKSVLDPNSKIGELREQEHGFRGEKSGFLPLQSELDNQTVADGMDCPAIQRPTHLPCWVSGDIRANENSALSSQHTFWMRQHNKLVKRLHDLNPRWNAARLYKTARNILIALTQRITYEHFLPVLLGNTHMRRFGLEGLSAGYYYGYDSSYDATVGNAFTTAAFRVGHSLIGPMFVRPNPNWRGDQAPDISLRESFFNNEPVMDKKSGGPNSILRGLLNSFAQTADPVLTNDLRNFLFAEQNKMGMDLLAINIQRGRDHGIPGYLHFRRFCGLSVADRFDELHDISSENQKKLDDLYRSVFDIDLYIGGLSEKPVEDGSIGPTFACLIGYQFRDLKKGDRFWHENGGFFKLFTKEQLIALKATTYSKLLCDGIDDMQTIQEFPMRVTSRSNPRRPCSHYQGLDITPWKDDYVTDYEHIDEDHEPAVEWTAWFPSTHNGVTLSSGETLSLLLTTRPDHVCHQVLDTETREVQGSLQVRYKCLPGTIKHSDFPPVLSEDYVWTRWYDSPKKSVSKDDDESKFKHRGVCTKPFAIQVQTADGVPAGETEEVFEVFSPHAGFVCRGGHQHSGRCSNYKVRYLCRIKDDTAPPQKGTWTAWVSSDTQDHSGDMEFLTRARRLTRVGCRIPIRIEARTVDDQTPAEKTGDRIRRMRPEYGFQCYNSDQIHGKPCRDYEVRFLCPETQGHDRNRRDIE